MHFVIYDRDGSPQGQPLHALIAFVRARDSSATCSIVRSEGYGETVHVWDRALDDVDEVTIPLVELEELSKGGEQWFYNLTVRVSGGCVFGLHDSTLLFIDDGSDLEEALARTFGDVRRRDGHWRAP